MKIRVAAARTKDVGRGIARIDPATMDELGIGVGDIIEISGKRKTYVSQVLEEGITEAGSAASLQVAATAYATHGVAAHPVLHLLLHVRLPADRRPVLGAGGDVAAASSWGRIAGRPRSRARVSSTMTAIRTCSHP